MNEFIKQLDLSSAENIYIPGDIHGEFNFLQLALNELGFSNKDHLLLVGDNIDRGSQNLEMITYVLSIENGHSVEGNHERMAINAFVNNDRASYHAWYQSGGDWIDKYPDCMTKYMLSKLNGQLPYCIEFEFLGKKIAVSHASIPDYDYLELNKQGVSKRNIDLLTSHHEEFVEYGVLKNEHHNVPVRGLDLSIHGHTGVSKPVMVHNRIYLDTGLSKDAGIGEGSKNFLSILCFNKTKGISLVHFKRNLFMKGIEWLEDVDNKTTYEQLQNLGFKVDPK
ncbi:MULTISPECIES: metallophosphoesterase [Vibrio]|uniref:Serine/threonine protein phosphatase n=1 Tax=Vibrio vulnificus TaxID=672 RepID=A0AAN1PV87_VIBVL|nr:MULTISPECIES: metallophosphoesterase [Vibrio]MCA2471786.1 metallophosphoesterase [Vibrio alginolyticus]TVM95355.1 hypothetical protein FPV63_24670 [Vibrio cholerae]AXX63380.1 Serine/threonine protein phosphatase [Vibrio vulnificus]EGR2220880.1 hypothetical protein [Vibrio parahaemolyticus]MBE4779374.1 hypothetical protein [Vibrio parahaemolyticus]